MDIVNEIDIEKREKEFLSEIKNMKRELMRYQAKEALNCKQFDFQLCTTNKGNKFIKIIYDSYEAGRWVEVARIHLSKNEWVQNNFSIKDIFEELKS